LFHELVDLLSIGLVLDKSLSVFKGLDKDVDFLIQLRKVDLHVFLLRLGVLSLLIRVETVHLVLLSRISSEILIKLSLLLVVFKDLDIKILDFRILSKTDLLEISLGVGVLLSHKSLSTLKSLSLNVVSSLWEEVAKVVKFILVHAHEDDIWKRLHWLRLGSLLASTFVGVWIVL